MTISSLSFAENHATLYRLCFLHEEKGDIVQTEPRTPGSGALQDGSFSAFLRCA